VNRAGSAVNVVMRLNVCVSSVALSERLRCRCR